MVQKENEDTKEWEKSKEGFLRMAAMNVSGKPVTVSRDVVGF